MITACEGSWPQRCSSLFASSLAASGSAASPVLLARVHVLDAIPLVVELATVLAERPFGTAGLRTNPCSATVNGKVIPRERCRWCTTVRACSESSMTSCSCGCGWTSKPTCRFAASPGVYEAVRLELRNDRGSEQGQVSLLSITSMTASNRRMASWRTRSRGTPAVGSTARAQSMPDRHPGLSSGRYRRPVECELGAARTCTAVEVRASRAARDDVAGAAGVDDGRLFEETDAGLLDSVALPRRRSYSGEIQVGIRHGSSRPRALSWSKANSESSRQSPHRSTDPVSIASELSHSAT